MSIANLFKFKQFIIYNFEKFIIKFLKKIKILHQCRNLILIQKKMLGIILK